MYIGEMVVVRQDSLKKDKPDKLYGVGRIIKADDPGDPRLISVDIEGLEVTQFKEYGEPGRPEWVRVFEDPLREDGTLVRSQRETFYLIGAGIE